VKSGVSPAFLAAERSRKSFRPASPAQRKHLKRLARRAGVELPRVRRSDEATDAITRLEDRIRQPMLEGWR
jgi:hypothetical protein